MIPGAAAVQSFARDRADDAITSQSGFRLKAFDGLQQRRVEYVFIASRCGDAETLTQNGNVGVRHAHGQDRPGFRHVYFGRARRGGAQLEVEFAEFLELLVLWMKGLQRRAGLG